MSAEGKIQNIITRLENGEELISDGLRLDDNFCILGLFADESDLGYWSGTADGKYKGYVVNISSNYIKLYNYELPDMVADYYGLINAAGAFRLDDLTEELRDKIDQLDILSCGEYLSIAEVNDHLIKYETEANVNQILIDIIKSGVIFKNEFTKHNIPIQSVQPE